MLPGHMPLYRPPQMAASSLREFYGRQLCYLMEMNACNFTCCFQR
jgi:hypothetical protein